MSATRKTKAEKEQDKKHAIEVLNKMLQEGDTVSGIVKRVSASGMSRQITFLIGDKGTTRISNISWAISDACGYRYNDNGSITVQGCGMNMVFAVVHDLEHVLGKKLNYDCP